MRSQTKSIVASVLKNLSVIRSSQMICELSEEITDFGKCMPDNWTMKMKLGSKGGLEIQRS